VTDRENWRRSRWKRAQAALIGALVHPAIALLGSTLRWRADGLERLEGVRAGGRQAIMVFWHGRILPATYFFRGRGIVVITSENFDGEWIARVITRFGYGTARGSTSRGARRALLQLRREMAAGRDAGFTLDGPRGPAERAQPGAIWLASDSGNPLVPFHIEAARCWTVRSWDRTQVPRPFSRMAVAVGEPIDVPAGASEDTLERYRVRLEASLAALKTRALDMLRSG
jgi:lysophospholipid acyltransferase (LPLAT)-like uncharacterized protein